MRGSFTAFIMQQSRIARDKRVAEEAAVTAALNEEAEELKRARIMNGAEASHINGTPYPAKNPAKVAGKKTRRSRKLKLFVWTDVLTDYTSGVIFALARDVQHAREVICEKEGIDPKTGGTKTNPTYVSQVWTDIQSEPVVVTKPEAFIVWGGG